MLLVFQLPARPTAARVRTWRRLHHLGALPIKNSGYALPNSDTAREDLEWLRADIRACGGDGIVFESRTLSAADDDELRRGFIAASTAEFERLAKDAATLRRKPAAGPKTERLRRAIADRLTHLDRIDFFGAGARLPARAAVVTALQAGQESPMPPVAQPALQTSAFQQRTWITRPRPGIDRFASAWLIRRFIDAEARFTFGETLPGPRSKAVPFDMFGAEFGHTAGGCTMDTLIGRFRIKVPGLSELATLVRTVDLRIDGPPEAEAVERMVEGLRAIHRDDDVLLERGIEMIEALFRSSRPITARGGSRRVGRPRR